MTFRISDVALSFPHSALARSWISEQVAELFQVSRLDLKNGTGPSLQLVSPTRRSSVNPDFRRGWV
jgi:hypothetical protein